MTSSSGHGSVGTESIKPGVPDPKETFEIGACFDLFLIIVFAHPFAPSSGPDDPQKYPGAVQQPNVWPDESHLPGFRADANAFMDDCRRMSEIVFKALTIAIPEIPDGFLLKCHSDSWHYRLLHCKCQYKLKAIAKKGSRMMLMATRSTFRTEPGSDICPC